MNITPINRGGVITWDLPGMLQSSTNVAGPYVDVPGATSPYTNSSAAQLYFRVSR
jgi:hypothetical protein